MQTNAQYSICTSYLQLINIYMQIFADELTNQNREYYKVNDNTRYFVEIPQNNDRTPNPTPTPTPTQGLANPNLGLPNRNPRVIFPQP